MNSSPWLAVAVYVRAPVADAPIATDIAANSESTLNELTKLQPPRLHQRRERLDDVGLRRDRIRRDDLGPAAGDRLGDGLGSLDLPRHGPPPAVAGAPPLPRSRWPRRPRRGSARGSPSPASSTT